MSNIERSAGRKLIEKTLTIGGTGAILVGLSEDFKPVAFGGSAALLYCVYLKIKDREQRSFGTKTADINISSQPALSVAQKEDNDSTRQDAAEYVEALERFPNLSFLYHGNPAWDIINVDTYEHSVSLPQSAQANIDAMQERLDFEDKDDDIEESNDNDSDGDSGDGGEQNPIAL